jgi:hypothetical protein
MTTRQYIKAVLSKFEVGDTLIDLIVVENSLDPGSEVCVDESKRAICRSLGAWLPVHSSVSEGGVSMSWNLDAIKLYYSTLCKELGMDDLTKPTIRDMSTIW